MAKAASRVLTMSSCLCPISKARRTIQHPNRLVMGLPSFGPCRRMRACRPEVANERVPRSEVNYFADWLIQALRNLSRSPAGGNAPGPGSILWWPDAGSTDLPRESEIHAMLFSSVQLRTRKTRWDENRRRAGDGRVELS
ncbi:hypothetical protein BU24DRAFT_213001 [Aaosphaeria arxii CBS 175.79]|uniref:Uncharacterized protein n=1 Tax=Aaosphaeria arxii CBS 175.79 TaxID=1450172 RepID=A0A6A5XM41_9PLEO|nr:uncharacterized protein BU24DRAFT_213001 [Aaosphaeria arxii CBS 175.79]KAF2014318.1 hypothetical protein BU24DRAFT_213001 [Aaosphaeria arxii CBS 175.79]